MQMKFISLTYLTHTNEIYVQKLTLTSIMLQIKWKVFIDFPFYFLSIYYNNESFTKVY